MRQNVGILDSTLRVLIGFALLALGFILHPPLEYLAFAGFLILAISGFVGKCPIYRLIGISTWKAPQNS
jgi:hypothetical protein